MHKWEQLQSVWARQKNVSLDLWWFGQRLLTMHLVYHVRSRCFEYWLQIVVCVLIPSVGENESVQSKK